MLKVESTLQMDVNKKGENSVSCGFTDGALSVVLY